MKTEFYARFEQHSSTAVAFDRIAGEYDSIWTHSLIGQLQRQQVWRELLRHFQSGERLLELGCGTGVDAAMLARAGMRIHATDISPEMLHAARARIRSEGLSNRVTFEVLAIEQVAEIGWTGPYDGIFSNFGAFNCVRNLSVVGRDIARLLRPEGKLALCYMGRFCAWETAWYLLHARPRKAIRRMQCAKEGVDSRLGQSPGFRVHYPRVAVLEAALRPYFALSSFRSVGLLVPPSYLGEWAEKRPGTLRKLAAWDERLGRWPVLRGAGDHRIAVFVRRPW